MTPQEITKLREQATRAKSLMKRSSFAGERAKSVMDGYEKTLIAFEANVELVDKEHAALAAAMAEIGNGGPILDEAFQDEPVSAKPSEVAHLSEVKV